MTKMEMARTLQRIRKIQNDVDALKRELDGLKDTVKAEMVATGEHKIEAGGCIASYQEVTSNRFNSSALKVEDKTTYDKVACQLEQADGLEYISEQADVVADH